MNLEKMAEKLRSLLRFGPLSTRYKDIFDFCYLKDHVDMPRLASCIKTYIIDEPSMREKDMNGVCKRVALHFQIVSLEEMWSIPETETGSSICQKWRVPFYTQKQKVWILWEIIR